MGGGLSEQEEPVCVLWVLGTGAQRPDFGSEGRGLVAVEVRLDRSPVGRASEQLELDAHPGHPRLVGLERDVGGDRPHDATDHVNPAVMAGQGK